jgi:hypothetical protein
MSFGHRITDEEYEAAEESNGHNFEQLKAHIIGLSVSKQWAEACREWSFMFSETVGHVMECPCGQRPIFELCWLQNDKNRQMTFVGNVCVKRFMGIKTGAISKSIKRVQDDPNKPLTEAAVEFAASKGWLTRWEHNFLLNTSLKRRTTTKLLEKRRQINLMVLRKLALLRTILQRQHREAQKQKGECNGQTTAIETT